MQDTEMEYLREKSKNMYIIDDELYFVIDEKNNSIDLTEKGREELAQGSGMEKEYFVLIDLGTEISKFENDPNLSDQEKIQMKDKLYSKYSEASERIHTLNQLLKAYTLFDKDVEYVITEDGKIAIVDEFTGYCPAEDIAMDCIRHKQRNVKVQRLNTCHNTLQNYFGCITSLQV
jgi:preprotein translocase subunit SecA